MSTTQPAPAAPTPVQTLLMLVAVAVVGTAYILLCGALGTAEFFTGFLFLLYWAGMQSASFQALPAAAIGSLFGLGLALAMQQLMLQLGATNGTIAFLVIVAVVVYMLIRGHLRLVVNNAAMIFLTLGTVSHIQMHASFPNMFLALVLGIALFAAVFWTVQKIQASGQARAAARSPAE